MSSILFYHSDAGIIKMMRPLLAGEGHEILEAQSAKQFWKYMEDEQIQLLVADVVFAGGTELLRKIRTVNSLPIIILSTEDGELAKIQALEAGADDYVTYPCNPLELLARIKSQLRRYTQFSNLSANIEHIYRVNGLVVDDERRSVSVEGREVRLTPIEYKILRLLVQQRGKVFSIEDIYESIWHMKAIGADNTIAVHIRHIREKIEEDPRQPRYLKVVWGSGYKVG